MAPTEELWQWTHSVMSERCPIQLEDCMIMLQLLGKHGPAGTALMIRSLSPPRVIYIYTDYETLRYRPHNPTTAQTLIFLWFLLLRSRPVMQGASWFAKSACFGLQKSCNSMLTYLAWIMRADGGRGHTKQALNVHILQSSYPGS